MIKKIRRLYYKCYFGLDYMIGLLYRRINGKKHSERSQTYGRTPIVKREDEWGKPDHYPEEQAAERQEDSNKQDFPHTVQGMREESKYYEDLIEGVQQGRNAIDKLIQTRTVDAPALVLATIGLHHPASEVVLRYLADREYEFVGGLEKTSIQPYYWKLIASHIEQNRHHHPSP